MSDDEGVRVDSYIELNRRKGRAIDQQLVNLVFGLASRDGSRTLVPTHEKWRYRYVRLDGTATLTPTYSIGYDTTYTVVEERGRLVVDRVEAKPLGEVK
jgi:hypothetical protein